MRRAATVIGTLLLAACAATGGADARWADAAAWPSGELRAMQRIQVRGAAGTRTLQAVVEASPAGLRVALLDATGRRLLWLGTGAQGFVEQRDPALPRSVDGRSILVDIVLAHWPSDGLRAMLPPGLALREENGMRTLSRRGRTLMQASCTGEQWSGRCVIAHGGGDVLTIDSRREAP